MKEKNQETRGKRSSPLLMIILLAVAAILAIGFMMKADINEKRVLDVPRSTTEAWKHITETHYQIFWRADLVNILEVRSKKGISWKEVFQSGRERSYTVTEKIDGEKITKSYNPENGIQEDLTAIVLTDGKGGSRVALLVSINILNPFLKYYVRIIPSARKKFLKDYMAYADLLSTSLGNPRNTEIPAQAQEQIPVGGNK